MHEVIERNRLGRANGELHLHGHCGPRRRVPRRGGAAHRFERGPAALRPGDRPPDALPRIIRVLVHYHAADDHQPRHVYLGEARPCALDLGGLSDLPR